MQAFGDTHRSRQRRMLFRVIVSTIGLAAIFVLLYLIGHLPVD